MRIYDAFMRGLITQDQYNTLLAANGGNRNAYYGVAPGRPVNSWTTAFTWSCGGLTNKTIVIENTDIEDYDLEYVITITLSGITIETLTGTIEYGNTYSYSTSDMCDTIVATVRSSEYGRSVSYDSSYTGASVSGGTFAEDHITAGQNYVDIIHGLGFTPNTINITPEDGFNAPYEVPRANIGATTFRVRYKDGVLQPTGTTGYFLWQAI